MVNKNIMLAVEPPKETIYKEVEIYTPEEIEKIITNLPNMQFGLNKHYQIIILAITTGMRLGELLGLRWCDVGFKKKEVHIRQSLQYSTSTGVVFEPPKSKAGVRKISIPEKVIKSLEELLEQEKVIDIKGKTLCFKTEKGTPLNPSNFRRAWESIQRLASVEYKNFHVLRHTHATQLLANNIPIIEVSRRLGHARVSHTLDIYGHAIPNYDQSISEEVSNIYKL